MSGLTDDITGDVACPQCGAEITKSLTDLRRDFQITCPTCGTRFAIDIAAWAADAIDDPDYYAAMIRYLRRSPAKPH